MPLNFIGSTIQSASNMAVARYNNKEAERREKLARQENFTYGEKSADAADARTRALYGDLYSPAAQIQQIKEAGLSPAIFGGNGQGISGKGGVSGAQGTGASGVMPQVFGMSPIDIANIGLLNAQKKKTEAETDNIDQDTANKEIENQLKELELSTKNNQWKLLNAPALGDENGNISWSELVTSSKNFEEFEQNVYNTIKNTGEDELTLYVKSEEGQKTLRTIYSDNKKFENEISVLANSKENADLMLQVAKLLNNKGFAKSSAHAQLKQLEQITESADLTSKQKGAMNRLIEKMGDSTASDIVIVLLMMLGQYSHANINFGASQVTSIKK